MASSGYRLYMNSSLTNFLFRMPAPMNSAAPFTKISLSAPQMPSMISKPSTTRLKMPQTRS